MKLNQYILVSLALLACLTAQAAVKLTVAPGNKEFKEYSIETDWYRTKVVEEVGGWGVSFHMPKDGPEWVPQGIDYRHGGGLFVHNLTGRGFGSDQFPFGPRKIIVVKESPEEVVLRVEYAAPDEPAETRVMTFSGASPCIRVDVLFTNNTGQSFYRGLWPKVHVQAGGEIAHNAFYRADTHGVNAARWSDKAQGVLSKRGQCENDFINDPVEGWMAQFNSVTASGLVVLMDYNELKTLYNCLPYATAEWFYEDTPLRRAGGTWKTTYYVLPRQGWTALAYASPRLLADHQVRAGKDGLELACAFGRSAEAVGDLSVRIRWKPLREDVPWRELPAQQLPALGLARQELTLALPGAPPGKSLQFAVEVTGKDAAGKPFTEKYDYLREEEDAQRFDLMAGVYLPVFTRPQPAKTRVYDKPAFRIETQPGSPLLELRGPGYYRARVTEAAGKAHIFDIKGSYLSRNFNGTAISYFPIGYEELQQYNVLVMNDVDALCLKHFSREMIADFVKAGGGLLVIGGPYALSNGRYQETQLNEILPVTLSGKSFSWQPVTGGKVIARAPGAVVLKDEPLPKGMECYWIEEVTPKPGATVELTVGGKPFLTCWEVKGRAATGRVAVINGSAFGDGTKGFWNAPEWPAVLAQVLNWLNQNGSLTGVPVSR
ncbi:MAG TPA: hypothetical protein VGM23_01540 [Armatimonadota bacterium]|jgi:uncharacterized membrane protein